jgi:hypothetical protein
VIYKFKSKAAGDVIMTGPAGDELLRALGRAPVPKGIFEPADMPALTTAIEQAIATDEQARAVAEAQAAAEGRALPPRREVSLRQRAWPLVEMMRRAHKAGEPIVWGV